MVKDFQKREENFICDKCGAFVEGDGYTNHCPECLWSKHVDVNPGDRQASCGGMMEPIQVSFEKGNYHILHKCQKCGKVKKNKAADNDNKDKLIAISAMPKGRGYDEN